MNIDAYCIIGNEREISQSEYQLLTAMDAVEVDLAVIAPSDTFVAVDNVEGNNYILKIARCRPERFIPTCTVNPWYGQGAVKELHRAVNEGARVLVLHPLLQGFCANDELIFPLLEAINKYNIPLYMHTGMSGNSTPWQLVNLAEKFPELDFIMGHSGATDYWYDVIQAASSCKNIYIESSLVKPFKFKNYFVSLNSEKGIMGSGAPLNDLATEWNEMKRYLPTEEYMPIYGGNMQALLEKNRSLL